MPLQPPPITPAFLAAVAACTWSDDHLINGVGATEYPQTSRGSAWALASGGDHLTQVTFGLLASGTANSDGSFTAASGKSYWLEPLDGWAVAVAK